MTMKNSLGVIVCLLMAALGGCAVEPQSDAEAARETSQAVVSGPPGVGVNPDMDAIPNTPPFSVNTGIYGGPYTDLAASTSNVYLLNKTVIERRPFTWPATVTNINVSYSFTGIHYVSDSWGLIASLNLGSGSSASAWIAIGINENNGLVTKWVSVPASYGAIGDLTGFDDGNVVTIFFTAPAYPIYEQLVKMTYDRGSGATTFGGYPACNIGYYSSGRITSNNADGYIYTYMNYYTSGFQRISRYATSCTWQNQKMGNYTENAYSWNNDRDRFAPDGMDIVNNNIVGIDTYVMTGNTNYRQQVLVNLPLSSVQF